MLTGPQEGFPFMVYVKRFQLDTILLEKLALVYDARQFLLYCPTKDSTHASYCYFELVARMFKWTSALCLRNRGLNCSRKLF